MFHRFEDPAAPARDRVSLLLLLMLVGFVASGGSVSTCNQGPCTPLTPGYDPVTGLCASQSGGGVGPVLPGSGGLPSELGTPTPTSGPNPDLPASSVDVNIYGLGGRWLDSGREVCVQHTGSGVFGTYYQQYECDHADGTNQSDKTLTDFEAALSGSTLTGTTKVCSFGHSDPSLNGIHDASMTLKVSADGKTLTGTWFNTETSSAVPITLTRQTVGDCHAP